MTYDTNDMYLDTRFPSLSKGNRIIRVYSTTKATAQYITTHTPINTQYKYTDTNVMCTHTHTHVRACARAHTHTHTHTH